MMRLMKRKLTFVGAICAVLAVIALYNGALAQADGASEQGGKITFFAMDTVMNINVPDADDALLNQCAARVDEMERLWSVTDETSEIARLNANGEAAISPDTEAILSFALNMCVDTDGALDITMYPISRAWGFTTGEYRVPTQKEIDTLLADVDYRRVNVSDGTTSIDAGCMVDLGSVAKGWATNELVQLLEDAGIKSGLLDLGGNIYCIGSKSGGAKWKIALKDPLGDEYCAALEVSDCAVVTSGCYERYFVAEDGTTYGHIFDPATGRPVDNGMLSVTVIGRDAAMCDALSTALFVMGRDKAIDYISRYPELNAVLVCDDEKIYATDGIRDSFTPMGDYVNWEMCWIER